MEVLAPAGSEESAKAAIDNGANAIYLGYSAFSARQSAENFDLEKLSSIVEYAHFCGACVYVAMNTVVKDDEVDEFLQTLLAVWELGVDAIILQDVLLGKAIKNAYPQIVLHLSTQAGVCTESGAAFAKECGFSRVILARETPLAEIAKITKIIETEAFVQGALCTCFSGQCYFSSFAGGNSGNRGRCKQPCRKRYYWNRKGFEEKAYALSLSDLCVGEEIEKYIQAGVTSFKIEGRMRRAEYVAAAVRYYRSLLDGDGKTGRAQKFSQLKRTYNRGNYTQGLAFGQDKRFLSRLVQGHIGEKVGVVKVINGNYLVESPFESTNGDAFKILREGVEIGGAVFAKKAGRRFFISSKARLKNGDGVFITTDSKLNASLLQTEKRGEIALSLTFVEGEKALVEGGGIAFVGDEILASANTRALTVEELKTCFSKTDGLPIDVRFEKVELRGNIFIPKSMLNGLRRAYFQALCEKVSGKRAPLTPQELPRYVATGENKKLAVIACDFERSCADIAIYKPSDYTAPLPLSFLEGDFEKYLYYPAFATAEDELAIEQTLTENGLDGVYVENYGGAYFAKSRNIKIFAGTGLNVTNGIALSSLLQIPQVAYYALSKELSERELKSLSGEKAFALGLGDIKLMELCYCPFAKACAACDRRSVYTLTDEDGRGFPVRRYVDGKGNCRFEVYNCATLIGEGLPKTGTLCDLSVSENGAELLSARKDTEKQKAVVRKYTSGHQKRGVL